MEHGAASNLLLLSKEGGIPLAETQADLTPFQRQVLLLELKKQHDELEEQRGQPQTGGRRPQRNPMHGGGGMSDSVTFINMKATDRYDEDGNVVEE